MSKKFEFEDLVLMWNARIEDKGKHGKFDPIWLGPYLIENTWGEDSYILKDLSDNILELPVQERIHLVEIIWESIAAFPQAIEVSPELKTELNARLADFERDPEAGYSWDQVKAQLKNGSWRTA